MQEFQHTRQLVAKFRRYARFFGASDAIRLLRKPASDQGVATLYSKLLKRDVTYRPGTSDLEIILKVLGDREYELPPDPSVKFIIDAGANIGASALFFAARFPQARIFAVEPEASNYALLTHNCAEAKNIVPLQCALWSRPARLALVSASTEKWAFTFQEHTGAGSDTTAVTIPEILAMAGSKSVDLLKLDIEGGEKELFSADCSEWLGKVSTLVIELHDRFVPGCSRAFYAQIVRRAFAQELRGENIFITFQPDLPSAP